jgi:chromosome segregation ATPase
MQADIFLSYFKNYCSFVAGMGLAPICFSIFAFVSLFLLYDTDMLEDLDHLSTRLAKLLAYTQQMFAEQTALQARLAQAEAELDAFRAQLAQEGTQAQVLSRQAKTAASERDVLQGSLELFKQEHQTLQTQLAARDKEVSALRDVSAQARQRIEAVLERLPGATQTEGQQ